MVIVGTGLGCRKSPPPAPPPASPPPPPAEVLARWHFVGSEGVNATTNGGTLKTILALPESQALLEQTLDKLSRAPYARLGPANTATTNDCADLLRPLFADLARAESYFERRAASNQPPEWALAVRLPPARAETWRTNLATTLSRWTGLNPSNAASAGLTGWRLRKHEPPNLFGLTVAREWVLVGAGQDALPLQDELAQRILARSRPVPATTNYWLQALVDWPRLPDLPPWVAALHLPKTDLTVAPKGGELRAQMEMTFPQPLAWNPEPWQFPTNIIRETVVGFTVMQGFGERLKALLTTLGLKVEPIPNQACLWSLQGIPFQIFAAWPVPDATNFMDQLSTQLPPLFNTNTAGSSLGSWRAVTNDHAIVWGGVPFFQGFMAPAFEETNNNFVFAGLFPNTPKQVTPPPDLFYQVLGRTNLAYYDWEIAGERLRAWLNLTQLALMLADKPQLSQEATASKWMTAVGSMLGNAGTALMISGPDRMTLIRQSPHGLTGFETVLLLHWLESVTFPWGYQLPALELPDSPPSAASSTNPPASNP